MDQTQQKALNALEPFIILAKSAKSPRAAAQVVIQATSAANTFVFAELLSTSTIQALRTASPEFAVYFTLLQVFSWGTWHDYTSDYAPSSFILCKRSSLLIQASSHTRPSQIIRPTSSKTTTTFTPYPLNDAPSTYLPSPRRSSRSTLYPCTRRPCY